MENKYLQQILCFGFNAFIFIELFKLRIMYVGRKWSVKKRPFDSHLSFQVCIRRPFFIEIYINLCFTVWPENMSDASLCLLHTDQQQDIMGLPLWKSLNLEGINVFEVMLTKMAVVKRSLHFRDFVATRELLEIFTKDLKTLMTWQCIHTRISSYCRTLQDRRS